MCVINNIIYKIMYQEILTNQKRDFAIILIRAAHSVTLKKK